MRHRTSLAVSGLAATALACLLPAQSALAQESPPASPAQAAEVGQKPGEGGAKAADGKSKPDAASNPPTSSKPSPQRFEPTEKVRPDFDVAFPVDI